MDFHLVPFNFMLSENICGVNASGKYEDIILGYHEKRWSVRRGASEIIRGVDASGREEEIVLGKL